MIHVPIINNDQLEDFQYINLHSEDENSIGHQLNMSYIITPTFSIGGLSVNCIRTYIEYRSIKDYPRELLTTPRRSPRSSYAINKLKRQTLPNQYPLLLHVIHRRIVSDGQLLDNILTRLDEKTLVTSFTKEEGGDIRYNNRVYDYSCAVSDVINLLVTVPENRWSEELESLMDSETVTGTQLFDVV